MSSDSLNDHSRPPSPTDSRPQTPGLFSSSSNGMGFFSVPFERFVRDDASEWTSAFTLLGTLTSLSLSRTWLMEYTRHRRDVFRLAHGPPRAAAEEADR